MIMSLVLSLLTPKSINTFLTKTTLSKPNHRESRVLGQGDLKQ